MPDPNFSRTKEESALFRAEGLTTKTKTLAGGEAFGSPLIAPQPEAKNIKTKSIVYNNKYFVMSLLIMLHSVERLISLILLLL